VAQGFGWGTVETSDDRGTREMLTTRPFDAWIVGRDRNGAASSFRVLAWARSGGWSAPALVVCSARESAGVQNEAVIHGCWLAVEPVGRDVFAAFLRRVSSTPVIVGDVVSQFARARALSARESALVAAGAAGIVRRAQLAEHLGVTEDTVKTMIKSILRKTRARSLMDLVGSLLAASRGGQGGESAGGASGRARQTGTRLIVAEPDGEDDADVRITRGGRFTG
jgi:DNA-binding NarL/FixJ family response regulator